MHCVSDDTAVGKVCATLYIIWDGEHLFFFRHSPSFRSQLLNICNIIAHKVQIMHSEHMGGVTRSSPDNGWMD